MHLLWPRFTNPPTFPRGHRWVKLAAWIEASKFSVVPSLWSGSCTHSIHLCAWTCSIKLGCWWYKHFVAHRGEKPIFETDFVINRHQDSSLIIRRRHHGCSQVLSLDQREISMFEWSCERKSGKKTVLCVFSLAYSSSCVVCLCFFGWIGWVNPGWMAPPPKSNAVSSV